MQQDTLLLLQVFPMVTLTHLPIMDLQLLQMVLHTDINQLELMQVV